MLNKLLNKLPLPSRECLRIVVVCLLMVGALVGVIVRPLTTNIKEEMKNKTTIYVPCSSKMTESDIKYVQKIASDVLKMSFSVQKSTSESNMGMPSNEIVLTTPGIKTIEDQENKFLASELKQNFPDDEMMKTLSSVKVSTEYIPDLTMSFLKNCAIAALLIAIIFGLYLKTSKVFVGFAGKSMISLLVQLVLDLVVGIGFLFLFKFEIRYLMSVIILVIASFALNKRFIVCDEAKKEMTLKNSDSGAAISNALDRLCNFNLDCKLLMALVAVLVLVASSFFGNFTAVASFVIPVVAAGFFDLLTCPIGDGLALLKNKNKKTAK